MDEKTLKEIEARRECWACGDHHAGGRLLTDDVPALVAEVRRLLGENGRLKSEISTLREVNGGYRG